MCDGEMPDFYKSKLVRARKPHRCVECGSAITPGEEYESATGRWEGEIDTYRTCSRCLDLRGSLRAYDPAECIPHTCLGDTVQDALFYSGKLPGRVKLRFEYVAWRNRVRRAREARTAA